MYFSECQTVNDVNQDICFVGFRLLSNLCRRLSSIFYRRKMTEQNECGTKNNDPRYSSFLIARIVAVQPS